MKGLRLIFVWVLSCLKPGSAALQPCLEPDVSSLPFCDTSLPTLERAKDLVSRLNTTEKMNQLVNTAPAIERLHIDAYQWWTESLHGVLSDCTPDGRCATSYPMPIGIGATFNMNLTKKMASQVSRMRVQVLKPSTCFVNWHFPDD